MSGPLALIGAAVVEVIGLNPSKFDWRGEANWPSQAIFGQNPLYQPTGLGDQVTTVTLAARPHVMGGLGNYEALRSHFRAQDVVPFIRLVGLIGVYEGDVGIRSLSSTEEKLAPDGVGRRWEFTAELLHVGLLAAGSF